MLTRIYDVRTTRCVLCFGFEFALLLLSLQASYICCNSDLITMAYVQAELMAEELCNSLP
jgi:hypothetical protein